MTRTLASAQSFDRLSIASANLLIETNTARDRHLRVQPQFKRTAQHIESFQQIEQRLQRPLDFIGLQELQITEDHHNGEDIRLALALPFGTYAAHSRKKSGEHIAAIGQTPDHHEIVELGKNRQAVVVRIGEVCLMFVHMSYSDPLRRQVEYESLMEFAAEEDNFVLSGDFNEEAHLFSSRRRLANVGLRSAFILDMRQQPITLPAPGYGGLRPLSRRIGYELIGGGLQFDDIYVKGELRVATTGTVDSASDHRFPYADIIGPSGIFTTTNT